MKSLVAVLLLAASAVHAQNVSITIDGQIAPGIYGRVTIGDPPVYNRHPVYPRTGRHLEPVYIYAPPGHRKNWRKHCRKYGACDRPVYFVREEWVEREHRRGKHRD